MDAEGEMVSIYCIYENKARAEGRRQGNIEKYQELWDSGKTRAPIGDRSPDFRFTLWTNDIIDLKWCIDTRWFYENVS